MRSLSRHCSQLEGIVFDNLDLFLLLFHTLFTGVSGYLFVPISPMLLCSTGVSHDSVGLLLHPPQLNAVSLKILLVLDSLLLLYLCTLYALSAWQT